ncbi:MAG TPA: GNAT family N-acetyltransferase [Myxococcota bacterium]|nr:GNAT family N-acetyltransferase [Myxococcota bacterium]
MMLPTFPEVREWRRGEYRISTDPALLDLGVLHRFLAEESYWAAGIPFETMRRAIEHSLPFGLYRGDEQVGFARLVTDYAVFAYVGDVLVLPAHRGRGLSKWLMEAMLAHPDLKGLRRWNLATRDAHELYRRFGFESAGSNTMDRVEPNPYGRRS